MSAFHCAMGKGSYLQVSYWLLLYYLVPFLFSLHLDYVFLHTLVRCLLMKVVAVDFLASCCDARYRR